MQTPVFLDHLPDIDTISGGKPERYRVARNKFLMEAMLDESSVWIARATCPACSQPISKSACFSQSLFEFQRCSACNTIYAARTLAQEVLDELRLQQIEALSDADSDREFEFVSLLNWVSITEARLERRLDKVLDIRFSSQAAGWRDATQRLSHNRDWEFLPLTPDTTCFAHLKDRIVEAKPTAILMPAELDRVADPSAMLVALKEAAASGTIIFVASSCADGLEYEILGADSPSFVPLDRLTVFSIKGFETLATSLGLKLLEISTPGRRDAVILERYFKGAENTDIPFWSSFFREADKSRLRDLQILLQRSLKSGVMRFVLEI